jgi:hypothetical protein
MNLSDPVMAQRFFDYVDKVVADIKYAEKIKKAYRIRKTIKGRAKNQMLGLSAMATNFASFDPVVVKNIDEYLEIAERLNNALKASRIKVIDILFRGKINIEGVTKYSNEQIERQEKITKDMLELKYPELFESGIVDRNSSLQDIRAAIYSLKESDVIEVMSEDEIRSRVADHIESDKESLQGLIDNLYDYTESDEFGLTKSDIEAIKQLVELDPSKLSVKDLLVYADVMANVSENLDTGNLATFVRSINGVQNAIEFFEKNGKAKVRTEVGRQYLRQLASLDLLLENVFASESAALEFMHLSGLSEFSEMAVGAQYEMAGINIDYQSKFIGNILNRANAKSKPNGKQFDHAFNIYERGMYAFLTRSSGTTLAETSREFEWRKSLLIDSIEYLKNSNDNTEKRKGKVYDEVAKKLGLYDDNTNLLDVESRVDKVNKKAHQYWVDTWAKYSPETSATARTVYNKGLSSDVNYTTDRYKKRAGKYVEESMTAAAEGGFLPSGQMETGGNIYSKESSSLMDKRMKVGSSRLPSDRYVDLDFDNNNSKMLEEALIDSRTAAASRQIKGFLTSSAFEKMIPNIKTRDLVSSRIRDYILRKRKKSVDHGEVIEMFDYLTNTIAKASTVATLASAGQTVKQTVPVAVSAAAYLAMSGRLPGFTLASSFNKEYVEWLGREGSDLAFRGLEAQIAIDKAELNLQRGSKEFKMLMKAADGLGQVYLEAFLKHPDLYIARATWLGFYKQGLSKYGGGDVDFTKPANKKAKRYADLMVNRMQNISDADKAGNLWTSKSSATKLLRKTNFTFANFIINQKVRQLTDMKKLMTRKNWKTKKNGGELHNLEEIARASKSVATIGVELMVYHTLSAGIRTLYRYIADEPFSEDEEQESKELTRLVNEENRKRESRGDLRMSRDEEKKFRADAWSISLSKDSLTETWNKVIDSKEFKTMSTSAFKDLLSPLPQTDEPLVWLFNEGSKTYNASNLKDEIQQELEIEAELHAERGIDLWSDEMSNKREEIKQSVIDRDAFQLWDFSDDSYASSLGTLGLIADVYYDHYSETVPMAKYGYYEDDKKGMRYLSKDDQELMQDVEFWEKMSIYALAPADAKSIMRYRKKRVMNRSLNVNQKYELDVYNKTIEEVNKLYDTNYTPITEEEITMVSRGSGSFKEVLEKTRKGQTSNENIRINAEMDMVKAKIKYTPEVIERKAIKDINRLIEQIDINK